MSSWVRLSLSVCTHTHTHIHTHTTGTVWNRMTVHKVMEGSQAASLGVKKGWMATAINSQEVTTPDMCVSMIESAKRSLKTFTIRFYINTQFQQQKQQQQQQIEVSKLVRIIKKKTLTSPSSLDTKKQQKRPRIDVILDECVFGKTISSQPSTSDSIDIFGSDVNSSPVHSPVLRATSPPTHPPFTPPRPRYQDRPQSPQHRRLIDQFKRYVKRSPSLSGNSVVSFIDLDKARHHTFRKPIIHIKGFASHLDSVSCQRHLDHFIDEIARSGAGTIVWDGDSYV